MRAWDRRSVLGWLALAPGCALASAGPARAAAANPAVPKGEYLLERVLERELAGGAVLVVTRSWRCRFSPLAGGMEVAGEQIACEVVTPPSLAALAELERQRVVSGLFPAVLDAKGQILRGGDQTRAGGFDAQIAAALAALGAAASADQRRFIAALGQTAAELVSQVPPDLFFPAQGEGRVERAVPVEGASDGIIAVRYSGVADSVTGLLRRSERWVETQAAGTIRHARECWTLTAA